MQCQVAFPPYWVDIPRFEAAIRSSDPHAPGTGDVVFLFPSGCKVKIEAAIRLLSLVNQLAFKNRPVLLSFEEGETGTIGYLNRAGFFDHLAAPVRVLPRRPVCSDAKLYRGGNAGLVEIARINREARDHTLPARLTQALMRSCGQRTDASKLEGAAWTIFAELIDNVFSHSRTPLDGYAALQTYQGAAHLTVAVSDSGLGIIETLRPSLQSEFPHLVNLTDMELLVEVFRQGLSRHGADYGCGLKGSATKGAKFNARLDVRLPNQRVLLVPVQNAYQPDIEQCSDTLPLIWGTHIVSHFQLWS
jgi:hypothetical protein